jgi:hypothetical protein
MPSDGRLEWVAVASTPHMIAVSGFAAPWTGVYAPLNQQLIGAGLWLHVLAGGLGNLNLCVPQRPQRFNRFPSFCLRLARIHYGGNRWNKSTGSHLRWSRFT